MSISLMNSVLFRTAGILCLAALASFAQTPKKAAPQKPAAAPKAAAAKPAASPQKSALDKATLEAYVRHLFVWGKEIKVDISDPKPSADLPQFDEVKVRGSRDAASQEETFLVSKDGQKIVRAVVFDVNKNPFKRDLDRIKTDFSPSFGTPGAPVVIVLFTDFQCPFCKEEAKMLRANIPTAYPKEVRVYFKDLPLEAIHPWAMMGAIAGRCIFRQNPSAFWEYYDWIYDHQAEINPANFKSKVMEFAKGKEIDTVQLEQCMDKRATEDEIRKSMAEAKELEVNQTPYMFVNGRRLVGQRGWPDLRAIIDYEIEYQKTAHNAGEDCGCEVKLGPALGN